MADIVLIHGTTQSAAGFADLVEALQAEGHRALTVDVPSGTAATAAEYADLLATQLPSDVDHPVVLAHSAAGLLLPAFAQRVQARHQIWLAAAVADHASGRDFLTELREDPTAVFRSEWLGVDPTSDPALATYFLFHDADLAALQTALPTVQACDLSAIYAEKPVIDPAAVSSSYLLPLEDRALQPNWMRHVATVRLHVDPTILPGGHNCFNAFPDRVASVITRACSALPDR